MSAEYYTGPVENKGRRRKDSEYESKLRQKEKDRIESDRGHVPAGRVAGRRVLRGSRRVGAAAGRVVGIGTVPRSRQRVSPRERIRPSHHQSAFRRAAQFNWDKSIKDPTFTLHSGFPSVVGNSKRKRRRRISNNKRFKKKRYRYR